MAVFAERQALPSARHSTNSGFAECLSLPSAFLCRVRHSAKRGFGTRQSILHSAKLLCPVVVRMDATLVHEERINIIKQRNTITANDIFK
jgi:hypothetical protein